jgi:spore coat polysaccharide biosynthesis protein SpsF
MKFTAIIQARMTSTRLPGKILLKVANKPLLEYQWERLRCSRHLTEIVIATTVLPTDDPVEEWCKAHKVSCFRGSEEDVLERYYLAAREFGAEHIVRITSDCPLIDPAVVDRVIEGYRDAYPEYDYVSNVLERTYPRGMDTEVFSFTALAQAFEQAKDQTEREHVTVYLYKTGSPFRLASIKQKEDWSGYRWTVDTPEDFTLISNIIEFYQDRMAVVSMAEIVEMLRGKPEWLAINAGVEQKKVQHESNV